MSFDFLNRWINVSPILCRATFTAFGVLTVVWLMAILVAADLNTEINFDDFSKEVSYELRGRCIYCARVCAMM